jgi:Asp-tRNA(Asn)/Glu-tRNA(Gln) amidotransferase A subunit family amidase
MLGESADYLRALRLRNVYRREMSRLFDKFDILLSPGAPDTAPRGLEYTGDPAFSGPWSVADFPTLSIPSAVASNGLPLGIQITAPPLQEARLFALGELFEHALRTS